MFNTYSATGATVAFMDCETGILYQYGLHNGYDAGEVLDEVDGTGGLLEGSNNMSRLLSKQPTLYAALDAANALQYVLTVDRPPKAKSAF